MKNIFYKSQIINGSAIMSFAFLYLSVGLAFKIVMMQMFVMVPTLDTNITTINLFYLFIVTSMLIVCMCYFLVGAFKYVFTHHFGKKEFVNSAKIALILYAFAQNSNILSQKTIDADMNKLIVFVIFAIVFLLLKKELMANLSPNDVVQTVQISDVAKLKYSWITFEVDTKTGTMEEFLQPSGNDKPSYKWYDASIK